jgi:heme/copper-type cytochrome/quinol oxidase subunit 2
MLKGFHKIAKILAFSLMMLTVAPSVATAGESQLKSFNTNMKKEVKEVQKSLNVAAIVIFAFIPLTIGGYIGFKGYDKAKQKHDNEPDATGKVALAGVGYFFAGYVVATIVVSILSGMLTGDFTQGFAVSSGFWKAVFAVGATI